MGQNNAPESPLQVSLSDRTSISFLLSAIHFFSLKKIEFLDSDISFPIHLNHLRPTPFRDARKAAQSILDRRARAPPRFRYMEDDRKQTNHVLKEISLDTATFTDLPQFHSNSCSANWVNKHYFFENMGRFFFVLTIIIIGDARFIPFRF